jgi:cell division protein FtsL
MVEGTSSANVSPRRTRREGAASEWRRAHTVALVGLIALIFAVGLIPPNEVIPGFTPPEHGLVAWVIIAVILMVCFVTIGHGTTGLWEGLLIDPRNKMSLSRLQLFLWTVLVLSAFLTVAMFNIREDPMANPLDIEVPSQVWGLLGISTTSFVAASAIKSQKKNLNVDDDAKRMTEQAMTRVGESPGKLADPQGALVAYKAPDCASVSDLFKGDEVISAAYFDLSKVQVFFFTLIVVFAYAAQVGAMLYGTRTIFALPELSTGIVTLLGISHAGYLTSKGVPSNPAHYERG